MQAMKNIFSTILMAALMLPVFAEGVNKEARSSKVTTEATVLMGKVVDQSTGEALPGAQVKINGCDQTVYTDLDGNFEVRSLKSGTYTLDISLVSYEENKIKDLIINANTTSALTVELKR
jgi:protocatechuate 3,4-dioxygenase beta subunit